MEINKYKIKEDDMLAMVDYQRSHWTAPKLTTLFFELTDGCNLNCRYCGTPRGEGKFEPFRIFLVEKLKLENSLWMQLTENFWRKQVLEGMMLHLSAT